MADGVSTYQSGGGGAGGKYRKKPSRRSSQATPYDRPPTALRNNNNNNNKNNNNNNNPSLLAKLVDPASRLLYAGADRLFGVFRKRLNSHPAQRLSGSNEEPRNGSQEAVPISASKNSIVVIEPNTNEGGNLASISVAPEISDLEIMLKQKTFTRSEIERLTALLHSKTTESNVVEADKAKLPSTSYHAPGTNAFASGTLIKNVEEREIVNFDAAISTPVVNSRAFEDDVASPAELAKAYMGTRPTKLSPISLRSNSHVPRQDLVLLNNTTTFLNTPMTSHTPKTAVATKTFENGLTTFRSRGRSALYSMPRTPYYRGPSTLSQKGVASPSAWEHEGSIGSSRMAAKRRSSALDDIGSGGSMRRIRQKANLPSHQSSLSKLGSSQRMLLRNEPEPKASKAVEETGEISKRNHNYGSVPTESSQMALKIFEHLDKMSPKEKPLGSKLAGITEKIGSPKGLSSSQDKQKSEGKQRLFSDARESTFQSKVTVEENGSRNINGSFTAPVSGNAPIIASKAGSTSKRAFSMSAHEDSLELDDDNHSNGHVSTLDEKKKLGTSVLANKDVSTRVGQTASHGVDPISVTPEFKKGAVSSDGFVSNTQKTGANFPASTLPVSQPTSIVDTVTPQNKPTVFPTFGTSTSNSAGPSGVKANISPDARPLGSSSLVDSTMNKIQAPFAASNKDDNVNTQKSVSLLGNSGSPSSAKLTSASTGGIFSFGASTNSSGIINGTSASSPSVFAFSSVQPSGTDTNKIFSSSSSPVISSATTTFSPSTTTTATATSSGVSSSFPASMSASIFSSGSATASLTSSSTAPTSPFASTFATSSNGGSTFGLSSPSATLTTNGFQASTQAASTSVTQAAPFKFSSGTGGVPSSTSASSLFSSSAPSFGLTSSGTSSEIKPGGSTSSPTTNMFGSGFGSSPSFGLNSTGASSETKSGSSTNMFGSGPSSTPSFGLSSTIAASSDTKAGNPTTNMFGSGLSSTPSFGISSTVATSDTKSGNSTTNMFGSGISSAPSFGLGSTVATSETKSGISTTNMFGSGFSSTPSFGVASAVATSETKSGSSTTNVFGTTPFSFGASSTSMPSASSSPFVFGSSNANATAAPSTGSSMFSFSSNPAPAFGNSTPVFGASPTNNNDNMSMEDTMADDTNQTPTPSVPAFGQASSSTPPPFMFGSATPTTPSTVQPPGFMFAAQTNQQPQPQAPSPNPFQAPQFNAGGSFSLGSGGDDKSNRRIVKVKRQVRRK